MKQIGIKLADGTFYPIMEDGQPAKKTLGLTTVNDNQTRVLVDVYRSKTGTMEGAEYVDSLQIDNLVAHPNGTLDINLNIALDENNKLHAEMIDPETGATSNANVTLVSRTLEERLEPTNYDVKLTEENESENPSEDADSTSLDDLVNETFSDLPDENESNEIVEEPVSQNGSETDFELPDFPQENPLEESVQENAENAEDATTEENDSSLDDFDLPDFDKEAVPNEEISIPVTQEDTNESENSDTQNIQESQEKDEKDDSFTKGVAVGAGVVAGAGLLGKISQMTAETVEAEKTDDTEKTETIEESSESTENVENSETTENTAIAEATEVADTAEMPEVTETTDTTEAEDFLLPNEPTENADDFTLPDESVESSENDDDFSLPDESFENTENTETETSESSEQTDIASENSTETVDSGNSIDEFELPDFDTDSDTQIAEDEKSVLDDDAFFDSITNDSNESESKNSANDSYLVKDNTPSNGINFEGLYDKETAEGNSSDAADQDETDEIKKKTKVPVIICVVCAIICVIATLLILFVVPSKYNLLNKNTKNTAENNETTEVIQQTEEIVPTETEQEIIESKEEEIVVAPEPEQVVPEVPAEPEEKPQDIVYKIKWGDTLWDIADAYYKNPWNYKKIARYNGIKNPDYIISGTKITIPAK